MLTADEIANHRTTSSCWLVIDRKVYDVTSYLGQHPGGAAILLRQAGTDATAEFRKIHSPDILEHLPKESHVGEVDPATVAKLPINSEHEPAPKTSSKEPDGRRPHVALCVHTADFEAAAKAVLPYKSYSYVSSFASSGLSFNTNVTSWARVAFRPRVLHDVHHVSTRSSILGFESPFPLYVSPMGQLGRSHEGGETALVRGLARRGIHGVMSTESTRTTEEVFAAFESEQQEQEQQQLGDQPSFPPAQLHFQLYIPSDREVGVSRIRRAKRAGFKSLWVTVDTVALGKRISDRRLQAQEALDMGLEDEAEKAGFGQRAHVPASQFNDSLTWRDLDWIRREWDGPIVMKGIQSAEDARLALRHGVQGILLSNHGGRQAHSAPDALTTLLEIRTYCPEVIDGLDVFVDGGCRDGADVLKAICLGAKAVGLGRPFFYALAAYGTRGVERCIDILSEELITGMKLIGINSLEQARPELVNASRLLNEIWRPERSRL